MKRPNWLKKKKMDLPQKSSNVHFHATKALDYHPKVLLAWAKAIEGNTQLLLWLKENDFPELAMATHAIYLRDDARNWLLNNGFPHLMAMINAAEGNESAQNWLKLHGFELLYHIALAVEDEQTSWKWLGENTTPDIFILTQTIKKVKDSIEEHHNDVHSFSKSS
jgi:hypothetical protein